MDRLFWIKKNDSTIQITWEEKVKMLKKNAGKRFTFAWVSGKTINIRSESFNGSYFEAGSAYTKAETIKKLIDGCYLMGWLKK